MKKFLWAALLALPCVAAGEQRAAADGGCFTLSGGFRIKICGSAWLKPGCEPFPCNGAGGGCPNGDCSGVVPGPWYTYWPGANGMMTAPQAYPGWTYDQHFQTPAPVYPYWPAVTAAPSFNAGFQPAGYYPSYWYGR